MAARGRRSHDWLPVRHLDAEWRTLARRPAPRRGTSPDQAFRAGAGRRRAGRDRRRPGGRRHRDAARVRGRPAGRGGRGVPAPRRPGRPTARWPGAGLAAGGDPLAAAGSAPGAAAGGGGDGGPVRRLRGVGAVGVRAELDGEAAAAMVELVGRRCRRAPRGPRRCCGRGCGTGCGRLFAATGGSGTGSPRCRALTLVHPADRGLHEAHSADERMARLVSTPPAAAPSRGGGPDRAGDVGVRVGHGESRPPHRPGRARRPRPPAPHASSAARTAGGATARRR